MTNRTPKSKSFQLSPWQDSVFQNNSYLQDKSEIQQSNSESLEAKNQSRISQSRFSLIFADKLSKSKSRLKNIRVSNIENVEQILQYKKSRKSQKHILSPIKNNLQIQNYSLLFNKSDQKNTLKKKLFESNDILFLLKFIKEQLKNGELQKDKTKIQEQYQCLFPSIHSPELKLKQKLTRNVSKSKSKSKMERIFMNELININSL